MAKFTDAENQAAIKTEIEGISQKLNAVTDARNVLLQVVGQLVSARGRLQASELFDAADVAEFDAKIEAKVKSELATLRNAINSTATLSGKVAIQFNSVEV